MLGMSLNNTVLFASLVVLARPSIDVVNRARVDSLVVRRSTRHVVF